MNDDKSMQFYSKYRSAVYAGMVGASTVMLELFDRIKLYSQASSSVVITGETGTGKELVAHALHTLSNRQAMPFVAVNCTALNEELLESELFGHERGAFTNAFRTHKGRFERAHHGTLFLDEIGEIPQRIQVKLLRVLEESKLERIGGETEITVDVRFVAATNIPLEYFVAQGRFRSDLYHRLAVLRIHVPPLRERKGDIPLLVSFFLDAMNRRYRKNILRLSPDAMRLLEEYSWPGNIRELRNVIERVYVETEGQIIGRNAFQEWEIEREYLVAGQWNLQQYELRHLHRPPIVPPYGEQQDAHAVFDPTREKAVVPLSGQFNSAQVSPQTNQFWMDSRVMPRIVDGEFNVHDPAQKPKEDITEKRLVEAYRSAQGNITQAAHRLNIHKATFYRYMKKFGLTRDALAV